MSLHPTTVTVVWDAKNTHPAEPLVEHASATGLVKEFQRGRGKHLWYVAQRGAREKSLRAACIKAIGEQPVEVSVFNGTAR